MGVEGLFNRTVLEMRVAIVLIFEGNCCFDITHAIVILSGFNLLRYSGRTFKKPHFVFFLVSYGLPT